MRARLILVLAGLYVSQGLPFGFFTQALPVLLRQSGASLSLIGLSNLLALPWALKFLWAPLFDQPQTRGLVGRRRAILVLQAASVFALGVAALADPAQDIVPVLVVVLVANLLAATQDIATDALAVDALRGRDRGLGNGIQVGGYRIGMIVGGGALLGVLAAYGWTVAMGLLAAALVVASLPLVLTPTVPVRTTLSIPAEPLALAPWLARPPALAWLGLLLLYKTGDAFGTGVVKPMLVDLGLGLADVGWLFGVVGSVSALAGAGTAAFVVGRVGVQRALVGFAAVQAATIGLWALVPTIPEPWLWSTAVAVEHFGSAMATTALFTAMMVACRPHRSAGDYTVQASTVVVAQGLASVFAGFSADHLGYQVHLLLAFVLALLVIPAAGLCSPRVWAPTDEEEEAREHHPSGG